MNEGEKAATPKGVFTNRLRSEKQTQNCLGM